MSEFDDDLGLDPYSLGLTDSGAKTHVGGGAHDSGSGRVIASLRRAWLNERNAPTLLAYESALVAEARRLVDERADALADAPVHSSGAAAMRENLVANLKRMELERVRHILRGYLRARLAKIEKYAIHLLLSPETLALLSAEELDFANGFADLTERHFRAAFLDSIPEIYSDILSEEEGMISRPNLEAHVFCRILETFEFFIEGAGVDTIEFEEGDIWILRYNTVEPLIAEGRAELI
jgi:GINS complex subunit 4